MQAIVAALLLFAPSLAHAEPQTLDFEFHSAERVYRSTTLDGALEKDCGSPMHVTVVLISTPSLKDESFRKQMKILDAFGHVAEHLRLLLRRRSPATVAAGGYWTTTDTAKRLAGDDAKFHVTALDGTGHVLRESAQPLSELEIRTVVKARGAKKRPK